MKARTLDPHSTTIALDARRRLLDSTPLAERTLRLAGISTVVLEGGTGRPLVLLHGPGEHALKWMMLAPRLVATHRVIAPDLPGHGSSVVTDGTLDVARVLTWVDELIDRTCAERPTLVGTVLGGAIAARYAAAHSDRLASLVLVDALGLAPFQPAPQFAAALVSYLENPTASTYDELWRWCAHDLDGLRDAFGDRWEILKTYNLDRANLPAHRTAQRTLMELFGFPAIPAEELARIGVPTTLIWGRQDLATSLSVAESAAARYGWPLDVIDGAGDQPELEQPAAFLSALLLQISSSPREGRRSDRSERRAAPGARRPSRP